MYMLDYELLAKARHHLKDVIEHQAPVLNSNLGLTAEMFSRAIVSQRRVVTFICDDREDVIEVYLDPSTGEMIDLIHTPEQPKAKNG